MDALLNSLAAIFHGDVPSSCGSIEVKLRLLRRAGEPFLLLPRHPLEAAATLSLYAPQTNRARSANALLRFALKFCFPLPGEQLSFRVLPDAAFAKFLSSISGPDSAQPPKFGILAGNARTAGQRFLVLCFDCQHQPISVVKLSLSARGNELVRREQSFLSSIDHAVRAVPLLLATFEYEGTTAFAIPFVSGKSPKHEGDALAGLLNSWIDGSTILAMTEISAWKNLELACASSAEFQRVANRLRSRRVRPCLQHGDFVPWNIKVSPAGDWTALDWERGEQQGVPGWDWFHYCIQTAILVRRETTLDLVKRAENLLASDSFKAYAFHSSISGFERDLLLGYLFHLVEVIQPSEGLGEAKELRTELARQWAFSRD